MNLPSVNNLGFIENATLWAIVLHEIGMMAGDVLLGANYG